MPAVRKHIVLIGTLVAALAAILVPVVLSVYIAGREATNAEFGRAMGYAQEVLRRSEGTSDQILIGISRLARLGDVDGCGPESMALMRHIDLSSSYIQAVGRIEGEELICSSLGLSGADLPMGPVDALQSSGVKIRLNVTLPFAEGSSFLVVESLGYAAIIHKDLPIDTAVDVPDVSLATYSQTTGDILTQRGPIDPAWITASADGVVQQFIEGDSLVVVAPSTNYLIGAVVALPVAHLNQRIQGVALVALPVGIVAGTILALAIVYLVRQQRALPNVIKAGLRRNEFFVVYQPIVALETGRWVGAETLLRWRRGGEMVRPDLFIPAAEESGLIGSITERVVELVSRDAANLFQRHSNFHIGINLSPSDLENEGTLRLLDQLTERTGAGSRNLLVEATERGFTDPDKAGPVIRQLRANGVLVAIDDFGTGYSSLSSLEAFDLDYLKIDKSFVDSLGTGAATSSVIMHIIDMAKSLNLQMIAEGVETEQQARMLRELGVQFAQGWLFARPMVFRELLETLEGYQA
ncbi:EAL domain-containing protein [Devosia sp. CAU 1758]